MFSAREAIIPGGIYDRSRLNVTNQAALRMFKFRLKLININI